MQYLNGKFIPDYDPTIEETYRKDIIVDGEPYTIEIIDTAGQEEYIFTYTKYIKSGDGFIFVYSVTNKVSFNKIKDIYEMAKNIKEVNDFPLIIVGNKEDLNNNRVISKNQGKKLAIEFNCLFYETSALCNTNIQKIFNSIVKEIIKEMKKNSEDTHQEKRNRRFKCTLL